MYRLIDTHSHLEEIENLDLSVSRARNNGVAAIIAVGQDYESNCQVLEMAEKYKSYVFPALGLHPGRLGAVAATLDRELQFIEDNVNSIVAIGEIGLDYKKDLVKTASKDLQKEAFRQVLGLAAKYNKPVSVHSRYSWRDCFSLVSDCGVKKAVFHWYTGPSNVLDDILNHGYLLSVTLAAEYHYEHKRAVKEAPLDRLMLETDSPVTYRGHKAGPEDVIKSLTATSELKQIAPDIIAEKTTENAVKFFNLAGISDM